jgi:hypothetical protein
MFFGDPSNAVQQMYVKINGSKITYDDDADNLKRIGWQMWYIDLSSLSVSNVTELSIGFDRIGAAGGQGVVYFDAIRLYRSVPEVNYHYFENFDSHNVGTNMHSVEGWEGWYGDENVGGFVTDEQAYSGNRSLRFTRPVDACPYWDKITSGSWTLTTMQYVPSTASSGDAYYGVLHSYQQSTAGSAGWITEVISDFAAGDVRISGEDTARVPLVRDAWAEIRTELNFDSQVASFYYNGALLGTREATGLAGFDLWANSDDVMYFDDIILFSFGSQ